MNHTFTGEVFDLRQAANSSNPNHQVKSNGIHSKLQPHQNHTNSSAGDLKRRSKSVNENPASLISNNNTAQQSKHQRNTSLQSPHRSNTTGNQPEHSGNRLPSRS